MLCGMMRSSLMYIRSEARADAALGPVRRVQPWTAGARPSAGAAVKEAHSEMELGASAMQRAPHGPCPHSQRLTPYVPVTDAGHGEDGRAVKAANTVGECVSVAWVTTCSTNKHETWRPVSKKTLVTIPSNPHAWEVAFLIRRVPFQYRRGHSTRSCTACVRLLFEGLQCGLG